MSLEQLEEQERDNARLAEASKENMAMSHAMLLQSQKRALSEQNQQASDLQQLNEDIRQKLSR